MPRRLALVLILAVPAAPLWATAAIAGPQIDPVEAHKLSQAGEVLLVDVRSPKEWQDTGTPQGAQLITMHGKRGVDGFVEAVETALKGDKSKPVALICAAGGRSSYLQRQLEARGFKAVYDVEAGVVGGLMSKGWKKRGLPMNSYGE